MCLFVRGGVGEGLIGLELAMKGMTIALYFCHVSSICYIVDAARSYSLEGMGFIQIVHKGNNRHMRYR